MIEDVRRRIDALRWRVRRFERREVREFRRWIEHTSNLVHLSILVFVPLLIGAVTALSNSVAELSFLLFPPLAAGTYTLFAEPEGKYSDPWTFVAGLTAGALSGWVALEVMARFVYAVPPGELQVNAGAAALGVFLTGVVTWGLDLEEPAAFSTALLVLVTGTSQLSYVLTVAASSAIVAGVFVVWRRQFYEHRHEYLYESIQGDDHVLVPMWGEGAGRTALFAARLAGAHDAGKVVLLDVATGADDEAAGDDPGGRDAAAVAADDGGRATAAGSGGSTGTGDDGDGGTAATAGRLEAEAARIRTRVGVPCEVVVAQAGHDPATTVLSTARRTNSDLIVIPYEERHGGLSPFVRRLFGADIDVIAFRSRTEREEWKRILVPVRRAGDVAHTMLDFALRLAGRTGTVAACHCIGRERERRRAEEMLATLIETFAGRLETRVSSRSIEDFLAENCGAYDLTIIGASTDRTTTSRFISPPTFERLSGLSCDIAIIHRG